MIDILISNLPYVGYTVWEMKNVPKEYGVEIFAEYGDDYYWDHQLPPILEGRTGKLSVHGPFCQINMGLEDCDFEAVKKTYQRSFDLVKKYHAVHCVCHPHAEIPEDPAFNKKDAHKRILERVLILDDMAKEQGIELLVENMPYTNQMIDMDDFLGLFGPAEQLQFLIDTGHAFLNRWDVPLVQKTLGKRIRAYHVHDNNLKSDLHLKVGEGPRDWKAFFRDYKAYTPDARLVLEYAHGPMDEIIQSIDLINACLQD